MAANLQELQDTLLSKIRKVDSNLKKEQELAVKNLLLGRDVLALLPTGFGKSRIFQVFSSVKDEETNGRSVVLVIEPLVSIIKDQISTLEGKGIMASDLSSLPKNQLEECNYKILFASAEEVMKQPFQHELKNRDSELHKRLSCIVVDESHTIETWTGKRKKSKGNKGKPEDAFRSAYGKLATLRSLCQEGVPVLALTGTADRYTQQTICEEMCLNKPVTLFISPNRVNLRFSVRKSSKEDLHYELDWLVHLASEMGATIPKTIIFCNTLKEMSVVINHLLLKLGKFAYDPIDSKLKEHLIIGIYHSVSWQHNKDKIVNSLHQIDGRKRIIIASTALSMGVDFPGHQVHNQLGPARTLLDQHQEAGRAGRDGKQSDVIVIYHGNQLSNCADDVKDFVKSEGCLRVAAYRPFDNSIKPLPVGHNCCSNCAKSCSCSSDGCGFIMPYEHKVVSESQSSMTRAVSEQDRKDVQQAFTEIAELLPVDCKVFGSTSHTFSEELVGSITENCHKLFTIDDINNYLPVFSVMHSLKILEVLQEIFGDIPELESTMHFLNHNVLCEEELLEDEIDFSTCDYDCNPTDSDLSDLDIIDDD